MMMKIALSVLLVLSGSPAASSQPTDTFKGCAVPDFSWATYSTSSTARMYAMRGAVTDTHILAAGFVKSTVDTDGAEDIEDEFTLTGPFSVDDPRGENAVTVSFDLKSYSASAGAKENAGGSFGQYDIGVAVIDKLTGVPVDLVVIEGDAMDETTGLAALGNRAVISGHFTGNLTSDLVDGSSLTIWNSNVGEGGVADDADQFHPNQKDASALTGKDDGFVIYVNTEIGDVEWMVHYPQSNQDSQITSVDLDDDLNVFGSGYTCTLAEGAEKKVCDAIVAMFASEDGSLMWEQSFPELGALFFVSYDREDGGLYVAGSTTFGGSGKDAKDHPHCPDDSCSVIMRLDSSDGTVDWIRTVKGSARWGVFDQSGGLELADEEKDGPYLYVALDDTGEGEVEDASLNRGTSYGGCLAQNGTFTPEYHVFLKKVVTQDDCDFFDESGNSKYVSREAEEAMPASSVDNGVRCGTTSGSDACLMKLHKHTGLPVWAVDVPPVAGLVPSADGSSVDISGWYYPGRAPAFFDSVQLPGYLREGGLGSQTSGTYNARLSAETGKGEYVMHSGGGSKDRLYDMVGDREGNLYNIGYHMNLRTNWGNNLQTIMEEKDVDAADAGSEAVETHMYVSKLAAQTASQVTPSCLTECKGTTDEATVDPSSCFIDGKCYEEGDTADIFGKSCFVCDPSTSQRQWSEAPTLGSTQCFIDNICVNSGDFLFYQRRTWSAKIFSSCQVCDPGRDPSGWSLSNAKEFVVVDGASPPNDCTAASTTTEAPIVDESSANDATEAPIADKPSAIDATEAPIADKPSAIDATEAPIADKPDAINAKESGDADVGVDVSEPEPTPTDADVALLTDESDAPMDPAENRLSGGAIAGIVIGSLVLLAGMYYVVAVTNAGKKKEEQLENEMNAAAEPVV